MCDFPLFILFNVYFCFVINTSDFSNTNKACVDLKSHNMQFNKNKFILKKKNNNTMFIEYLGNKHKILVIKRTEKGNKKNYLLQILYNFSALCD